MFNDWIFRIIGIGAIGVLLDVLMPDGETNKYVKSVFAIITVFVIISPLSELLKKEISFDGLFNQNTEVVKVDYGYVKEFYRESYDVQENRIERKIKESFGINCDAQIRFVESCPEKIDVVYLYFKNTVIDENEENTYIIEEIKGVVKNRLGIGGEKIIIRYG